MLTVAIRTDNPQAELYLYEDGTLKGEKVWQAHRELSATIHLQLQALLQSAAHSLADLTGIIFYQGPGSFTGLRIGISVANALGSSLDIPVVATMGDAWIGEGLNLLTDKKSFIPVEPFYGSEAHITLPKK